jgi:hypothetical protein
MVTIGDVFAVIFALTGIGLTAWALTVSCALLFPERVHLAREGAEKGFWRNLPLGLLVLLVGLVGVVLLGGHLPAKMLGWLLISGVLGVGAVGAAGLSHLASTRLKRMAPEMGEYPAFVRGAGFIVTASMLPVLGWFLFAPAVLLTSFACGARAAFHRNSSRAIHPTAI